MRVKMSWARERLGYFAYCGSEPMIAEFSIEMGFDVQGMMGLNANSFLRPTCHGIFYCKAIDQ